jgi:hypothetical protein
LLDLHRKIVFKKNRGNTLFLQKIGEMPHFNNPIPDTKKDAAKSLIMSVDK